MWRYAIVVVAACGRVDFDAIAVPPGQGVTASGLVAAGDATSCAIRAGNAWCWGATGTTLQPTPVELASPTGLVAIASGTFSTCAIDAAGAVWCWGNNAAGELGDGSRAPSSVAVQVSLPAPAVDITVGGIHACAVLADTSLWCWGGNGDHEVDPDDTSSETSPVHVLDGAAHVSAGEHHSCAVKTDRSVWCWGQAGGQIGPASDGTSPVQVAGVTATAIAAGAYHTCALLDGGRFSCWGQNGEGQLGRVTGSETDDPNPGAPSAQGGFLTLTAGSLFTCGLTADGVSCWGDSNIGELGQGDVYDTTDPVHVAVTGHVVAVASGGVHTCALRDDDTVACWGGGSHGELGDGRAAALVPQQVLLPGAASAIAAGGGHACAVLSGGADVWCWGQNNAAQLGTPTPATGYTSNLPIQVPGVTDVTKLALGGNHSCALEGTGPLVCWGGDYAGQLGDGQFQDSSAPTAVQDLATPIQDVAAGTGFTCAISLVQIQCWGNDLDGELGDGGGAGSASLVPVPVAVSSPATISAGELHACTVDASNTAWCWGSDDDGQLGTGATGDALMPAPIAGQFQMIAAGSRHTCAGLGGTSGRVQCWGANDLGQLGDDSGIGHDTPAGTTEDSDLVQQVTAYGPNSCALVANVVLCWGQDDAGQAGDGTAEATAVLPRAGMLAGVTQLATGDGFSCALIGADGEVDCWGDNLFGEIGDGKQSWSLVPVDAGFP